MENANNTHHNDLFSSLVSDIKSYNGKDPLLPWLRGIKRMKESLPPEVMNEKLPRFLQKCTQSFESDRRYRNDLRYIRVWLQLMDFVDDPKVLLRTMEGHKIGIKTSLFYQAFALYYEKMKKFEESEKMYHLGVKNLAEPADELQKSYEQFLHRMERHKKKKLQRQEGKSLKGALSGKSISLQCSEAKENCGTTFKLEDRSSGSLNKGSGSEASDHNAHQSIHIEKIKSDRGLNERMLVGNDDTVVVKFVDTAIVGKSEAENACHHGLVEPTVNMKEAMDAINSMFREPIETAPVRRSQRSQKKEDNGVVNGFEVFIDENLNNGFEPSFQKQKGQQSRQPNIQPSQAPFQIFIDDDENMESEDGRDDQCNSGQNYTKKLPEHSVSSGSRLNTFGFLRPKDYPSESSDVENSPRVKFREDTVVHRFVGTTISDEPEVENVCHHGLVDPTINLKEAMEDINNMFGKPIDFVRSKRSKNRDNGPVKEDPGGFSILPDDDLEPQQNKAPPKSSRKFNSSDLFEPTGFTKEAMDDINKMFAMPLDF